MDDRTRYSPAEIAARLAGEGGDAKGRRRLLLAGGALVLVVGLAVAYLLTPAAPRYVTAPAERTAFTVTVSATGTLEPYTQVDVGAEISGRIEAVYVDFNDPVTKGAPLALIDTEELSARVVQAEATLASAKATLAQSEATVVEARARRNRTARLAKGGTSSQQELEIADAALARAEASVAQAEAQIRVSEALLNIDRTNLARAEVKSPIDGIVLDRMVEPGQTIAATFQTPVLFRLAEDLTRMRLHVDVDEADVGLVRAGQSASFTVDAFADQTFKASVESVHFAPRTQEGVVTYEAVLDVSNPDLLLRPGMTADAELVVEALTDTLTVPSAALRFTPPDLAVERVKTEAEGEAIRLRSVRAKPQRGTFEFRPPEVPAGYAVVWLLERGTPTPIAFKPGASDGVRTAVTGAALKDGARVIVAVEEKASRGQP